MNKLTPEQWIADNYGENWLGTYFDGWTTADVICAMEGFYKEKLREELIKFLTEYHGSMLILNEPINILENIDEYLKTKE